MPPPCVLHGVPAGGKTLPSLQYQRIWKYGPLGFALKSVKVLRACSARLVSSGWINPSPLRNGAKATMRTEHFRTKYMMVTVVFILTRQPAPRDRFWILGWILGTAVYFQKLAGIARKDTGQTFKMVSR